MSKNLPDAQRADAAVGQQYVLRLYVTGATPRSARAIANAKRICDTHLQGLYELEVVDIYRTPSAASRDQIVAVPTLVKLQPAPLRKIIGDLSDEGKALQALGISIDPSPKVGSP